MQQSRSANDFIHRIEGQDFNFPKHLFMLHWVSFLIMGFSSGQKVPLVVKRVLACRPIYPYHMIRYNPVQNPGRVYLATQACTRKIRLDPRVLHEIAPTICNPLTEIFQTSFRTNCLPKEWKHAIISVIFQKGNITTPKTIDLSA